MSRAGNPTTDCTVAAEVTTQQGNAFCIPFLPVARTRARLRANRRRIRTSSLLRKITTSPPFRSPPLQRRARFFLLLGPPAWWPVALDLARPPRCPVQALPPVPEMLEARHVDAAAFFSDGEVQVESVRKFFPPDQERRDVRLDDPAAPFFRHRGPLQVAAMFAFFDDPAH